MTAPMPAWIAYLQVSALPIIGLLAAWIAGRQMLIADDKLDFDIFQAHRDRRVTIYEATREILLGVFENTISADAIRAYGFRALDAQFLFDDELYEYLRAVQFHVAGWYHAKNSFDAVSGGLTGKEHLAWMIEQGDEHRGLATKFRPYLVHYRRRRPWWLRWP